MSQTLAAQVQDLTKFLRHSEKEFLEKRKENCVDEDLAANRGERKKSLEPAFNDGEAAEFHQMEQIAVSRDAEIGNLVKGINDLAVIFKELSVLVIDQGNILDRIDYNIEQAVRHTKKANVQLHKV